MEAAGICRQGIGADELGDGVPVRVHGDSVSWGPVHPAGRNPRGLALVAGGREAWAMRLGVGPQGDPAQAPDRPGRVQGMVSRRPGKPKP